MATGPQTRPLGLTGEVVDAIRYGILGTSDVAPLLAIAVTCALAAAMPSWSVWLFRMGHKLKP